MLPAEPLLGTKGIAVALADGIGSSEVSQHASEFAVRSILDDYYCTSEAWSVRKSVERVLAATNAWLHSRTRRSHLHHEPDRGYVCTLSAVIFKSTTAHLVHVGDARIYRWRDDTLEQLTTDHRAWVSEGQSLLSRAVGFNAQIEIDYQALPLQAGDVFLLATDGVHEHVDAAALAELLRDRCDGRDDLDRAARAVVEAAYERGSPDNFTVQIAVVEALPEFGAGEFHRHLARLPMPPAFGARASVDGMRIVRELHVGSRSRIHLAVDEDSGELVALKTPSVELQSDSAALERFLLEEWVARRIDNAHVLKPRRRRRERSCLYVATEFVEGRTLRQWLIDEPEPELETVRGIVEQIVMGVRAFHRLEMLHQDLRPDNIMIDKTGTVKIIDFGAAR